MQDIRDIMDGSAYKKLGLSEQDISCCINTDGVAIFNSAKFSVWPLLISINGLDYKLRRQHIILAGIWFGEAKPNFDTFLEVFVNQCKELSVNGITWDFNNVSTNSKVYFPMFAADSVARCQIQCINQFNGEFSCPWCLIKGETYWIDDRKHKWIFDPLDKTQVRNHSQFINHLRILQGDLQSGKNTTSVFGIKSASRLMLLPKFDMVEGFVFDYMHTCLLGVVRTLTCAWLDSKRHGELYYIGNKQEEINSRIRHCKFPVECQRVLRELKDVAYWKAQEWKLWMIMAVPLLKGILNDCYLKHFSKFARAIYILAQNIISAVNLEESAKLIHDFCILIPNLYDRSFCTYNIHLLSHAVDCDKQWGPLWAYSLFQFENYNGVLNSYFSGTTYIGLQIAKKDYMTRSIFLLG